MVTMRFYIGFIALAVLLLGAGGCEREEASMPIAGGGLTSPMATENEIKFLKGVIKDDPNNLPALIKLGNILMDSRQYAEAIETYEKALKLDPKNTNTRVDMGTCLRYAGIPQRAVEEYRKAIKIDPKHLNAHLNLGVVLSYDLGDLQAGVKEFETFIKLAPGDPRAPEIRKEIERLKGLKKQSGK